MVSARMIFADNNLTAFLVASTKFIINTISYFVLERAFNRVSWGTIIATSGWDPAPWHNPSGWGGPKVIWYWVR